MNSNELESKIKKIKNDILGKQYKLSIGYVTKNKSREINKKYRKKNKPTNILSFALRKNEGELILCKNVIKDEIKNQPKNFDRTFEDWLGFLVIHGMLHLKGMSHSSTMERLEKKYDQKYFSRNRRGLISDSSRSGRVYQGRKKS